MSDELKPCPCGKPALTEECPYPINFDRKLWKVCCEDDDCGWEAIGIGPEGAIAAWNRQSPTGGQDVRNYKMCPGHEGMAWFHILKAQPALQIKTVCPICEQDAGMKESGK